jgi:nucleoside-diphosphate-sugar epimerase
MRIVITGPTGAIGIALIHECISRQIEVLAICHKNSKRRDRIPESPLVRILELDLQDYRNYVPDKTICGCDIFYHLAWSGTVGDARNDMRLQHDNIGYALDAAELAHKLGCHTFIGAGSQAEYGRVEGPLSEELPTFPENGYGIAKLCAGRMTRIACTQLGMKHIWTRILSVYGPNDGEKTMIISAVRQLLRGEIPQFTKGEQKWDYLYCDDAARAMLLLGEKGKDGQVYCIGSGSACPLAEYIEQMRAAVDEKAKVALGAVPYGEKQVMYLCADISRLKEDTGFVPEVTFQEGIKRTVAWVRNHPD